MMRALALTPAVLALASACAVPSPVAAAQLGRSPLSPRLARLSVPSLRGASPARQAERIGLPAAGPGSLQRDGKRVLVEVGFDHGAVAAAGEIRAAGGNLLNLSRRYQTATVAITPDHLPSLAALGAVDGVTEILAPLTFAPSECPSGVAVSEGDGQLRTAEARSAFGVDGSGVTVGILSDSYNRDATAATHAAGDVGSGDLPGGSNPCGDTAAVEVLDDSEAEGADEGRAMAQIVHDLAPGAKLAFASAFTGETAFANNIERLAEPASGGGGEAGVIADDVAYFDEPFFQDGPVAAAVNKTTAEGVSYFSAAGNNNVRIGGRDVGSWQAQFEPSGCPAGTPHYSSPDQFECADFNGSGDSGFGIDVAGEGSLTIDLQWAEPWYGVGADIDAYLLGASNNVVAESEYDNPGTTKKPFEFLSWENPSASSAAVRLVIKRYSGSASPMVKFAMLENGAQDVLGSEYSESTPSTVVGPTIFGHSGSAGATSVAAVPFGSNSAPEYYSSRGPVDHYFGPVTGTSPAAALPTPETLAKPDLAATDCGQTTFFAFQSGGAWRFCGTSAAAPHAAGVAALMRDADSSLAPSQIREVLAQTAGPVGEFPGQAVGAGLIDAFAALGSVTEPAGEPEEEGEEAPVEETESVEPEGTGEEDPLEVGEGEVETAPLEESPTAIEERVRAANPAATTGFASGVAHPQTYLRRHPARLLWTTHRRRRAVFLLASTSAGASFACRFDRGRWRTCPARLVRRFGPGRHVLRAIASSASGASDPTPAVFRFRVKRLR